jgi:hypothetical protein
MQLVGVTISGIDGLAMSMTWCQPGGIITVISVFGPASSNAAGAGAPPLSDSAHDQYGDAVLPGVIPVLSQIRHG